jgi:prepilin-type processing-associated H-X9-DG protein
MYTQDYDERLPISYQGPGYDTGNTSFDYTTQQGWAEILQPYLKSTQIFQCPSESKPPVTTGTNGYTDYWANYGALNKSDASFDSPAQTVLLGDGGNGDAAYICTGCVGGYPCPDAVGTKAWLPDGGANRHLDGTNVAFVDGHVKWEKGITGGSSTAYGYSAVIFNVNTSIADAGGSPTFSIN